MSPMLETERVCPNCGAVMRARDLLTDFLLAVIEVVYCSECGTECPLP